MALGRRRGRANELMAAVDDLSLKKFLGTYKLPQVAKVTQGYCTENDDDEQDSSTNDVLKVSHDRLIRFFRGHFSGRVEQPDGSVCVCVCVN